MSARPVRVLHVITRMIVGGAQENTMISCADVDPARFPSELLTGPETGAEGSLHEECRARGVQVHVEPSLVRRVSPWHDLVAVWRLWRFLRRGRYDVVHTHSSKAGILGRIAARAARVPVIVHTVHGWGFHDHQSRAVFWTYVWLERLCARWTHRLVVVGTPDAAEGRALGIGTPDQYVLIRSGIELDAFRDATMDRAAARRLAGVPDDAFVIGTVGRLGPQKAPLDLLAAFERVAAVRPDAHLVFVGDGPQRAEVESRVGAVGLAGRVHLLGLRRDVPQLQRAFDVFALASRWEGLPRVFPQAMAAGLPIVATRVDGATDAIAPGVNGWLVAVGDVSGLAERLLELAGDPAMRARMSEAGRVRVEEFSAERMVRGLEDLYAAAASRVAR